MKVEATVLYELGTKTGSETVTAEGKTISECLALSEAAIVKKFPKARDARWVSYKELP